MLGGGVELANCVGLRLGGSNSPIRLQQVIQSMGEGPPGSAIGAHARQRTTNKLLTLAHSVRPAVPPRLLSPPTWGIQTMVEGWARGARPPAYRSYTTRFRLPLPEVIALMRHTWKAQGPHQPKAIRSLLHLFG